MILRRVDIQQRDFSLDEELRRIKSQASSELGASASFIGYVRGAEKTLENDSPLKGLFLEHYPAMTQQSLESVCQRAEQRFHLQALTVIHRVGFLAVGEQIVMVLAASAHRGDAIAAVEFVMDYLKRDALFWKKAVFDDGENWIEQKQSDCNKLEKWQSDEVL